MELAAPTREQALAKTAFALMSDWRVAPTPDHYELFYVYAGGTNPALSKLVETMISEKAPFTPAVLQSLCAQFLVRERTARTMEDVGHGISGMIDTVLGRLEKAGKDAGEYGRTLTAASGELGGAKSPAAIAAMVQRLAGATQAMEVRTKALEGELQRSSDQVTDLKTQLDTVRKESRQDTLTGLANRKAFDLELAAAIAESRDSATALTLLMCDIDHFKRFNDTWGHQTGDQVLRLVAGCLSENVKGRDTAARYGGEEFVVILRQTTLDGATKLADQIRGKVENKKLVKRSTGDILGTITISVGVAEWHPGDAPDALVQRADCALYRAKNTGRNRVVCETELVAKADSNAA
jgi:diguanylate cyclase